MTNMYLTSLKINTDIENKIHYCDVTQEELCVFIGRISRDQLVVALIYQRNMIALKRHVYSKVCI